MSNVYDQSVSPEEKKAQDWLNLLNGVSTALPALETVGGTIGGAALGTVVAPGLGTAGGAALGGAIGSGLGNLYKAGIDKFGVEPAQAQADKISAAHDQPLSDLEIKKQELDSLLRPYRKYL